MEVTPLGGQVTIGIFNPFDSRFIHIAPHLIIPNQECSIPLVASPYTVNTKVGNMYLCTFSRFETLSDPNIRQGAITICAVK